MLKVKYDAERRFDFYDIDDMKVFEIVADTIDFESDNYFGWLTLDGITVMSFVLTEFDLSDITTGAVVLAWEKETGLKA